MSASHTIGVPSPQSVDQVPVTRLRWEYLEGNQLMEHVEFWFNGRSVGKYQRSIGLQGNPGPSGDTPQL